MKKKLRATDFVFSTIISSVKSKMRSLINHVATSKKAREK